MPFSGNQSFRAAVIQPPSAPAKPGQARQPPQVPPKPGARSREASRERPRDEETEHLETELKNILRGNNKEFDKNNGQGESVRSETCLAPFTCHARSCHNMLSKLLNFDCYVLGFHLFYC